MSNSDFLEEILKLSIAADWKIAQKERSVVDMYKIDGGISKTCLCGKHPISEIFVIKNKNNATECIIWGGCINNFHVAYAWLFTSLNMIRKDNTADTSINLIKFSYKQNVLVVIERDFLLSTYRKHNLSDKQRKWKISLNKKIVDKFRR